VRRSDRLFQIVQFLRGRRLTTAAQLAGWLRVSERTIYRDLSDLAGSGVPIDGEAGVGYRLDRSYDLPPIMFTFDELEALIAGARMIEAWGGPELAAHSRTAISKAILALPRARREEAERIQLFAPAFAVPPELGLRLQCAREAINARHKLSFGYESESGTASQRVVRPLALFFWGAKWTLLAWCEARTDFRSFRIDRMRALAALDETFPEEPAISVEAFFEKMRTEGLRAPGRRGRG
jgi:predicted DNA-binding transcriptional regulator YafY